MFRTLFNNLSSYGRAGLALCKALVGPRDHIDSLCSRGHPVLENWPNCPHCRLINRKDDLRKSHFKQTQQSPKLALYCVSGANMGKNFLISSERVTIGCDANSDIVLTPESLNNSANYQILINGKIKMSSSETFFFKLNGQSEQSATLLDFDELEVLDNRFLVLDLRNENGGSHDL